MFLLLAALEIVAITLDLIIDKHSGECVLQASFQLSVSLLATQAQRIASDDHQINMLHVRYETQSVLLDNEVVSEVQFLELNVLIFLIQRIRMKSLEFVSAQV